MPGGLSDVTILEAKTGMCLQMFEKASVSHLH